MTEAEWLSCADPRQMLDFLRGRASDRKLRMFAVACCRQVWHLIPPDGSRQAVQAAEEYADGLLTASSLEAAEKRSASVTKGVAHGLASAVHFCLVQQATSLEAPYHPAAYRASYFAADLGSERVPFQQARTYQCAVLGDICGNPFRAVPVDRPWATPAVTSLARSIYDRHQFDRLPELADALAAAGCMDAQVLAHCRGPGPHVRGCWVVDLILGKS